MSRIEDVLSSALEEKIFPGAALLVASKGEILYRNFFGYSTELPHRQALTDKTLFDIASLTKPLATTMIALASITEKKLSLNTPLSTFLPDIDEEKEKITLRHLLKHTSGLPSWKPYYLDIEKEYPDRIGQRDSRTNFLEKITQESLEIPVSYQRIYSDVGFILLGILLENLWGRSLDDLFAEKVAGPLNLHQTFFMPVGETKNDCDFAATEDSVWRKKILRGEVHDDNAYTLGGVAGHAGLFSHVDDLHTFLTALEKGNREGHALFQKDVLDEFIGPKVKIKLGWDTPDPLDSQAGRYFSRNSIGHLGYTGCSFWVDLEKDFHIIFLTNRVHPSSKNEKIKIFRPLLHDVIYEELIKPS